MGYNAYLIHTNITQLLNEGNWYIYDIKRSLFPCGSILECYHLAKYGGTDL